MELKVDFLMLDPVFSRNHLSGPLSPPFQTGTPGYESMVIDITELTHTLKECISNAGAREKNQTRKKCV